MGTWVYFYKRTGTEWNLQTYYQHDVQGMHAGFSVAMGADKALISAAGECIDVAGSVLVFEEAVPTPSPTFEEEFFCIG